MVERRNLVGGGLAAGIAALVGAADADAAVQRGDDSEVSRAVRELRQAIEATANRPWARIARIREQQRTWLQLTRHYPDFIEIGIGVWDALYEWHVRFQQPVNMARMTDGRYVMTFMFTTLILRPEVEVDYVGQPFDADPRPSTP
jgi:hypothetical protein